MLISLKNTEIVWECVFVLIPGLGLWGSFTAGDYNLPHAWMLLVEAGCGSSSSLVQRDEKKKVDILMVKTKLAPKNSMPLTSREKSNDMVILFPTPDFIQAFLSLLPTVGGWKGRNGMEKGGREKNSQSSHRSNYTAPRGIPVFEIPHQCGPR